MDQRADEPPFVTHKGAMRRKLRIQLKEEQADPSYCLVEVRSASLFAVTTQSGVELKDHLAADIAKLNTTKKRHVFHVHKLHSFHIQAQMMQLSYDWPSFVEKHIIAGNHKRSASIVLHNIDAIVDRLAGLNVPKVIIVAEGPIAEEWKNALGAAGFQVAVVRGRYDLGMGITQTTAMVMTRDMVLELQEELCDRDWDVTVLDLRSDSLRDSFKIDETVKFVNCSPVFNTFTTTIQHISSRSGHTHVVLTDFQQPLDVNVTFPVVALVDPDINFPSYSSRYSSGRSSHEDGKWLWSIPSRPVEHQLLLDSLQYKEEQPIPRQTAQMLSQYVVPAALTSVQTAKVLNSAKQIFSTHKDNYNKVSGEDRWEAVASDTRVNRDAVIQIVSASDNLGVVEAVNEFARGLTKPKELYVYAGVTQDALFEGRKSKHQYKHGHLEMIKLVIAITKDEACLGEAVAIAHLKRHSDQFAGVLNTSPGWDMGALTMKEGPYTVYAYAAKVPFKMYNQRRSAKGLIHASTKAENYKADGKAFQCLVCRQFYPRKENALKHIKRHRKINFPCKYCKCTFGTEQTRETHQLEFHTKTLRCMMPGCKAPLGTVHEFRTGKHFQKCYPEIFVPGNPLTQAILDNPDVEMRNVKMPWQELLDHVSAEIPWYAPLLEGVFKSPQ